MTESDPADDTPTTRPPLRNQIIAQKRRLRAFHEGVYELSDDEGFYCDHCGWRGLTAPMADDWADRDEDLECPDCGTPGPTTYGTSAKYLEQFAPGPLPED